VNILDVRNMYLKLRSNFMADVAGGEAGTDAETAVKKSARECALFNSHADVAKLHVKVKAKAKAKAKAKTEAKAKAEPKPKKLPKAKAEGKAKAKAKPKKDIELMT
jgi:hypothetical protein